MNPTPKEHAASEAKRLLEEMEPYFAELERRSLEEILRIPGWGPEDDQKRRCLADRIVVVRDVKAQLQSIIAIGKRPPSINRVA
jgi:hypothetical protein